MTEAEKALKLQVNGEEFKLPPQSCITDLLKTLELNQSAIAVEINAQITPADRFEETMLHCGDVVEIVSLVGGG